MEESRDFYITELLRLTGYDKKSLEKMPVVQLYKLYCERIDRQGMV